MQRILTRLMLALLAVGLLSAVAHADNVPVGLFTYDTIVTGSATQLDITNFTGVDSFPPDFPIYDPTHDHGYASSCGSPGRGQHYPSR